MFKEITSLQNPIIKRILLLKDKAKQRNIEGVFVIEGQRELSLAIKGGYVIKSLLFEPNLIDVSRIVAYKTKGTEIIQISTKVSASKILCLLSTPRALKQIAALGLCKSADHQARLRGD